MINIVELVIIGFMIFITIYAVVDRVCKCIENKNNAKAFSSISNPGVMDSLINYADRMNQK